MNQYMATLAIDRPGLRDRLERAQATWLTDFTDPTFGGTWATVTRATGAPNTNIPKHFEWNNAFHSFEHALVQQMSAAAMSQTDLTLYFARADQSPFLPSYGFTAEEIAPLVLANGDVQAVTFSGLDFASPSAVVPLPASLGGMILCLGALGMMRRYSA